MRYIINKVRWELILCIWNLLDVKNGRLNLSLLNKFLAIIVHYSTVVQPIIRNYISMLLKGIVHPKMILFTLKLFQIHLNFFLRLNTKEDILMEIKKKILWNSKGSINCLVSNILQKNFCVQLKKEIHTCFEQLEA